MNRLSFLFAALMAASLAIHAPKVGDAPASESVPKPLANSSGSHEIRDNPEALVRAFTNKALKSGSGGEPGFPHIAVLFATVPHPLETHLAGEFDHNVDALQDGIQDAGYLFDSAFIPWRAHPGRATFDDEEKERAKRMSEDGQPGVLLFRNSNPDVDPYEYGLVVFLVTEKPTQGIAYEQVKNAVTLITSQKLTLTDPVRIVGPTFSGSYASLVPMVRLIAADKSAPKHFRIRSGSASVSRYAVAAAKEIGKTVSVDMGTAKYDDRAEIHEAMRTLGDLGIADRRTAILTESESTYGAQEAAEATHASDSDPTNRADEGVEAKHASDKSPWHPWSLVFPRDISSLRAEYQKQGVLEAYATLEPWKRSLSLKEEETREGDSVRTFGGPATNAAQESVLLGISDFLRAHGIGAVIVSASNEEDRYFLAQFLHAHNGGVRVVIIGATRLFMRGATAQFRGDLMVDDFPMLPRLTDWTGGGPGQAGMTGSPTVRTFADESAEGTYFATLDSVTAAPISGNYPWIPGYSEPAWDRDKIPQQKPSIYVVALGSSSAWPLEQCAEKPSNPAPQPQESSCDKEVQATVQMPFTLFGRDHGVSTPPKPPIVRVATAWKLLFCSLILLLIVYCLAFWYSDPVGRSTFASFAPVPTWRFAIFKSAIPGILTGSAFDYLSSTVNFPFLVLEDHGKWWIACFALGILSPAVIAGSAFAKASMPGAIAWRARFPLTLITLAMLGYLLLGIDNLFGSHETAGSQILNRYREMHWESGVSLVPTVLLLLLALQIWTYQAGQGEALCECAPPLPELPKNQSISSARSGEIARMGRPFPWVSGTLWLWLIWAGITVLMAALLKWYEPLRGITTLEPTEETRRVLWVCFAVASLMLFDVLQFGFLWSRIKSLLRAVEREQFKRSFVPIQQFDWRTLWSFGGASFPDRRVTEAAQIDCVIDLAEKHGLERFARAKSALQILRDRYTRVPLKIDAIQHWKDREEYCSLISDAGTGAVEILEEAERLPEFRANHPRDDSALKLVCKCKENDGRFSEERDEVAALPASQKTAERLVCLLYIGLIEMVVARLHSLLVSVAAMFSLTALAIAIYPFAPTGGLLAAGLVLLALIAFSFFKVFSGMDTNPVLARIVNGDDRKLEWSFYSKFAESMALPLLTLASTMLPGGTSRLLELVRVWFSHGQ